MKKSVSMLLLFVLLINTFSSSLMIPRVFAETQETHSVIESIMFETEEGLVSLTEATEEGNVVVNWSTESMDTSGPVTETITIPDYIITDDQSGDLLDLESQSKVGRYELTKGQLTLSLSEFENKMNTGSIKMSASVKSDNTVRNHVYESGEDTSLESIEESSQSRAQNDALKISTFSTEEEITDNFTMNTEVTKDGEILEGGTEIIVEKPFSNTTLSLNHNFVLKNDHGYGAGANYTITIDPMFTIPNVPQSDPNNLVRPDGKVFGSYHTDGNDIIIVFNKAITEEPNISGNIKLEAQIDDNYDGPAQGDVITFPYGESEQLEFPISFRPDENGLDKKGIGNRGYNTETMTWTVDVNKNLQTMTDVVVSDQLIQGDHNYISGSFKVYKLKMYTNGTFDVLEEANLIDDFNPVEFLDEQSFKLQMGDISDAYRIIYETKVNDTVGTEYKNNVSLNSSESTNLSTTATVAVTRGKPLEKTSTGYDNVNQTIDWEVKYNYDQKEITKNNAVLTDTFNSENQQYKADSMAIYSVSIDPETGRETGEELYTNYSLNVTESGYTVQFNEDINGPYKIKYQTETKNRVDNNLTVTNTIKDEFENTSGDSQTMTQGILIKKYLGGNFKDKTASWSVVINRDEEVMRDVTFTDTLPNGFTFDPSSVKVTGYDGEPTITYNESKDEISIVFLSDVTKKVTVTYTTDIDFDVAGRLDSYKNSAVVEWIPEGETEKVTKEGTATFRPDGYTKNNGFKFGSYNVANKEITWTIGVNYNNETLNDVKVTDPIQGNQTFTLTDVKIFEMELTGGANGFERGKDVTSDFVINDLSNESISQFEVDLGNITSGYVIEFTTDFAGKIVEKNYNNTATVTSSNHDTTELEAKVSPKYGGEYTTKSGQQDNENGRIVHWNVNINRSQSKLNNLVITDSPSVNQTVLKDSIKIYGTTATSTDISKNPDQLLREGTDYEVEINQNSAGQETYTIKFINDYLVIEEAYVLEYDTYILYEGDGKISNDLSINGEQVAEGEGGSVVSRSINFRNISGTISGEVGSLTLQKVDAENETLLLEGAEFTLYDETGEVVIKTGTTGVNGEVTFNNLLAGNYQLKETKAPSGYQIDDRMKNLEINFAGNQNVVLKTLKNYQLRTIPVEKVWKDDNQPEARPATIAVELLRDGLPTDKMLQLTSENNWKGSFNELAAIDNDGSVYTYTIAETNPGEGYELQSISGNQTDGFTLSNIRVGKTSISGKKTWLDGQSENRPTNIQVNLMQNDELVMSQEVSEESDWKYSFNDLDKYDANGVVYDYTIVEEPVPGYTEIYEKTDSGYDITNVRSGMISVAGEKTWVDGDGSERPESITINLLRNGEEIDETVITSTDDWVYKFVELEEYDEIGVPYVYTITEDPIEGYETTIDGYNLTNLRTGTLTIAGEKIWQDGDSNDRPASIFVNLLLNDVVLETREVTEADNWTYQFEDLPEFDESGERYSYDITEHGVPGYKTDIDGYDIINTRTDNTSVTVNKIWLDDEVADRPDDITVHLLRNGERIDTVQITKDLNWTYTFNDLDAFDELGQAYVYTVEEVPVEGYETIINGYDITNKKTPIVIPEQPEQPEGPLPNTATTLFNYLLMGAALIVLGWISLVVINKKKAKDSLTK